ncbi:MAG: ATP-binding protein [Pseudomonadota bacterium]
MRFLPSFVFSVVLLIIAALADREQVRAFEAEKRDAAQVILNDVQRQVDSFVTGGIRSTRRLARRVNALDRVDQQSFATLAQQFAPDGQDLVRAEHAPGFVTQHVYPLAPNTDRIGRNALDTTGDIAEALGAEVARGFPVVRRLDISTDGVGTVLLQTETRGADGASVVSEGMVTLLAHFRVVLTDEAPALSADQVDFLVLSQPFGTDPPPVPEPWQTTGNLEPFTQVMQYPPGDFQLFLRPTDGWRPTAADMMGARLQLLLFGGLLLLPVVLANWFAVSRVAVRTRLADTRAQMSGLVNNLPGAALSIEMAPHRVIPTKQDVVRFFNPHATLGIWRLNASVLEQDGEAFWNTISTPDAAAEVRASFANATRALTPFSAVWPIQMPDGETKWLQGSGSPVRLDNGATVWSMLVIDHTPQVQRQKEIERQHDLLLRAQQNESIGQLTGGVAHDFNNLLAVILGNLELMDEISNPDEIAKRLDAAKTAARRGAGLTKSLLSFARQARLDPSIIDINATITEMETWSARVIPKNIEVEISLQPDLWPIETDLSQTQNAILNLILNARDAMPSGGCITIETANQTLSADDAAEAGHDIPAGRYAVLMVSDTGEGIAAENLNHIFDPYFTTKPVGMGSGLGLSMVQGFLHQAGGTIRVTSQPGVGTTFRLFFPAMDVDAAATSAPPEVLATASPDAHILVVEDEPQVLAVLEGTLELAGYTITTATSGDEARRVWDNAGPFDLLLTDIVMPGATQGTALAGALRQSQPNLPVVFISGYSNDATTCAHGTQADDIHLIKPVRRTELLAAIAKALQRQPRKASASGT